MQPIIKDCTNEGSPSLFTPSHRKRELIQHETSTGKRERDSSITRNDKAFEIAFNQSSKSIGLSFTKQNRSKRSIRSKEYKENKASTQQIESDSKIKFKGLQPKRRRKPSKFCEEEAALAAKSALKTNESEIAQNGFLKEPITKGIDSFTVVKKLGEGSFSQVFKVIEKETNSLYALKVMEKEGLKELQVIDRLASELKIQSFSNHVNIVKLYGQFHDERRIYLIQEYAGENTLYSLMEEKRESGFTLKEVQAIIFQICNAVRYLHANNIIHRDIKPENILIAPGGVVKLTDFGWSVHNPDKTMRETICGTPLYLSPELIAAQKYNESVDLWAIGILTYELLTGQMPFGIKCFQDLRNIITEDIDLSLIPDPSAQKFISMLLIKQIDLRKQISEICEQEFICSPLGVRAN